MSSKMEFDIWLIEFKYDLRDKWENFLLKSKDRGIIFPKLNSWISSIFLKGFYKRTKAMIEASDEDGDFPGEV